MSQRGRSDEPSLFDLPLVPEDEAGGEPSAARRPQRPGGAAAPVPEPEADRPAAAESGESALFTPDLFEEGMPPPAGTATGPAPGEADFPFSERPPPHRAQRPASRPFTPAAEPVGWDALAVGGDTAGRDAAGRDAAGRDAAGGEAVAGDAAGPPEAATPATASLAPTRAGLGPRLLAAALDGVLLASAAALALAGAALLDVRAGLAALPGLAALVLVFSFAYSVVPLAFWGATPGMRAARLVARDRDGGPLTFGQTALRWLAGLLTLALAGLPMLLALRPLGARSPADRLSRSRTWQRRR